MPILQPSCQTEPHPQIQRWDDLPDKVLQEAREVHQQALEVAHILELNIERLSLEATEPNAGTPTAAATLGVDSKRGMPSPQSPIGQGGM